MRNVHYPPLAGAGCTANRKAQVGVDKRRIELLKYKSAT